MIFFSKKVGKVWQHSAVRIRAGRKVGKEYFGLEWINLFQFAVLT